MHFGIGEFFYFIFLILEKKKSIASGCKQSKVLGSIPSHDAKLTIVDNMSS